MFIVAEIARDDFNQREECEVIGGIISPVHDSYRKPDLVASHHRCAMVKISLQTSDWIRLSDWECNEQKDWTRTLCSLQYHQVRNNFNLQFCFFLLQCAILLIGNRFFMD